MLVTEYGGGQRLPVEMEAQQMERAIEEEKREGEEEGRLDLVIASEGIDHNLSLFSHRHGTEGNTRRRYPPCGATSLLGTPQGMQQEQSKSRRMQQKQQQSKTGNRQIYPARPMANSTSAAVEEIIYVGTCSCHSDLGKSTLCPSQSGRQHRHRHQRQQQGARHRWVGQRRKTRGW